MSRFCLHILTKVFGKIPYYGLCSAARCRIIVLPPAEAPPERAEAAGGGICETGPGYICPFCKKGRMDRVAGAPANSISIDQLVAVSTANRIRTYLQEESCRPCLACFGNKSPGFWHYSGKKSLNLDFNSSLPFCILFVSVVQRTFFR